MGFPSFILGPPPSSPLWELPIELRRKRQGGGSRRRYKKEELMGAWKVAAAEIPRFITTTIQVKRSNKNEKNKTGKSRRKNKDEKNRERVIFPRRVPKRNKLKKLTPHTHQLPLPLRQVRNGKSYLRCRVLHIVMIVVVMIKQSNHKK